MVDGVDFNDDNKIYYSEFIAATLDPEILKNDVIIEGLFNQFDIDNNGSISKNEIVKSFSKFGKTITVSEINTIFNEHDTD